ncbi:hypothetical protein SEMRO_447_G144990.1 [Seminavis robusta]|uniref:Uncharacterized protein n=1 Tax=Seminavis robusta TaxID=568900 RepID=A0A9N8DXR2_9STRA|nr:hypothetical protein SEMRO_447_G144990.1 [Seminavis robusta]|eukprot:Sro447_g144990.1 n/a (152) ;mRNA; f:57535-57990
MQLDDLSKAKLHKDIEDHPDASCEDVVRLRPNLYGGVLLNSVRNRFHYLRRLKEQKPKQYWKIYAEACSYALRKGVPVNETEEDRAFDGVLEEEETIPPPAVSNETVTAPATNNLDDSHSNLKTWGTATRTRRISTRSRTAAAAKKTDTYA